MCFSVQVDMNIKNLAKRFNANIETSSYSSLLAQKEIQQQITSEELKKSFGLKRKTDVFKLPGEDNRIFPGVFSHVMTLKNNQRIFEPMRYRVRPHASKEEIPSKFNVFNARIDSLEKRKTWSPLFMRNHGLFVFNKFYEWVEHDNKKKLIRFFPNNNDIMWAPCLWDEWHSPDKKFHFKSFAIITNDPPTEIEQMGHDRCPIFLKEEYINDWLSPHNEDKNEIYEILTQVEDTTFEYQWA